jgi:hypothetical protein
LLGGGTPLASAEAARRIGKKERSRMLHLFELNCVVQNKKAAAPASAGVTASVNTVSLNSVKR